MIKISLEKFNDLRTQSVALVEELRPLGKDKLAFQLAVALCNGLIDAEDHSSE